MLLLVYEQLRYAAAERVARLTPTQTLQHTALVHEAWLRPAENDTPRFPEGGVTRGGVG